MTENTKIEKMLEEILSLLRVLVLTGVQEMTAENERTPRVPPRLYPQPPYLPDYDKGHTCSVCGVNSKGVMGYVCSQMGCPSGFGTVTC